ncbi:hypothetical protein CYMTET_49820 [Cymbomonas tetramitiformis]|uniref:Uncharacterized protein n=1 Tax=Cymbomonas tetramitiformis TaxID=36881 RepID=A0AAE0BQS3_9CHLO|nr:hypothetical protein CYMTET_49820 [Cymbomonas tetramitiformis]
MAQIRREDLSEFLGTYSQVVLFVGFGARAQFNDVEKVYAGIVPHLDHIEATCTDHMSSEWLAVYGGDVAIPDQPDLGMLMKLVAERRPRAKLLVVQSWNTLDTFVDFVVPIPQEYSTGTDGKRQQLWGGLNGGEPVAATRVYLGPPIIDRLSSMIVAGGGRIALEEVQYATQMKVPIVYLRAEARHTGAYGTYGPVHDWVEGQKNPDILQLSGREGGAAGANQGTIHKDADVGGGY